MVELLKMCCLVMSLLNAEAVTASLSIAVYS